MARLQTNGGDVLQDVVTKAVPAAGLLAQLQHSRTFGRGTPRRPDAEPGGYAPRALAAKAGAPGGHALDGQGISVEDYGAVLMAADVQREH